MQLLMCKDKPIYNITTQTLIDKELAPGQLSKNPCHEQFKIWSRARYSSQTNIVARQLQGGLFGQGNRRHIDSITKSLSLSDSYWIKDETDTSVFCDISPYYVNFWTGLERGSYIGQSVPTLYVDGVLPKYWLDKDTLVKQAPQIEVVCAKLAKDIGLKVADVQQYDEQHVLVKRFTSPDIMYEAADTSGLLDVADFTYYDILDVFNSTGVDMLVFDAIIGNIDRHTGNFGFLKCAETGRHLTTAPLFDFDQALSSHEVDISLIRNVSKFIHETALYVQVNNLIKSILQQETHSEILHRAKILQSLLTK